MPFSSRPVLFLDDGGVMNDNALRAPQWRRLLGEVMPGFLGGTPEQWAEANRVTFRKTWGSMAPRMAEFAHQEDFQRELDLLWLRGMCNFIGIPAPNDDRALEIATAAAKHITARVRSDYPDAAPAVRSLHEAGFVLHTASGTRSFELEGILSVMGVRECFGHLFGPDLVDALKGSADYYRRIFAAAGVDPASAIVLDDSQDSCIWAKQAGAEALLIGRGAPNAAFGTLSSAARHLIERYA
jgi:beta-phosphoglucomutase-like phosphatase (HAD superfamily)